MISIIGSILAFFVTFPLLITFIVYYFVNKTLQDKRRAVYKTVNWTTIFYIISTGILLDVIFGNSFSSVILIIAFLLLSISAFIQWKVKGEILFQVVLKGFWRLSFLLFGFTYIALIIVGLTIRFVQL
jgi:hypothetical protein